MPFPTTHWTLLADATLDGDAAGREALGRLCESYRRPVLVFLRARGVAEGEAEDLVQDFFEHLLKGRLWKRAARERGRFRTFLLGVLRHVMRHAWRDERRLKRGGGMVRASLEELEREGREVAGGGIPDGEAFDREWALTLVAEALRQVEGEHLTAGRQAEYAVLRRFLPGAGEPPSYEAAAAELGVTVSALKSAIHRLRLHFRKVLRTAVAQTVGAPHEVDEELRHLARLLMRAQNGAQPGAADGE